MEGQRDSSAVDADLTSKLHRLERFQTSLTPMFMSFRCAVMATACVPQLWFRVSAWCAFYAGFLMRKLSIGPFFLAVGELPWPLFLAFFSGVV